MAALAALRRRSRAFGPARSRARCRLPDRPAARRTTRDTPSSGSWRDPDFTASLRGRDLLSVADLSADEVVRLFDGRGAQGGASRATRRHAAPPLAGRTLAMLFQKPSLRTRVTFEAGMNQLGGHADLPDQGRRHGRPRERP